MIPHYEVKSQAFPVDSNNPEQAQADAQQFYDSLPGLHPDANTPQGAIGERIVPFFFIAGGMWIVVYFVLYYYGGR